MSLHKENRCRTRDKGGKTDFIHTTVVEERDSRKKRAQRQLRHNRCGTEKGFGDMNRGKQKRDQGAVENMEDSRRGVSVELLEMVWQSGSGQKTFCDVTVFS